MKNLLKKLLETEDKSIQCDQKFIVVDIKFSNDLEQIILDLIQNDENYKDVVMIKGTTFPLPYIYSILLVNRIYLKYDSEFKLKLFVEGKFEGIAKISDLVKPTKFYSFDNNIIKTISELTEIIMPEINSNVFRIINLEDKITVKSIFDSKVYWVEMKQSQKNNFKLNDFLWICNYEVEQNILKKNKLTTIEILDNDKLLDFLDNSEEGKQILFQVIDIDEDNIILFNKNEIIYKLKKNQKMLEKQIIDWCMTIIISNYSIKNNKEIELNDESFIHTFRIESYYIDNIVINLISILEIHFLDFRKENNKYDCITSSIFSGEKMITKNIEYIYFDSITRKKFEFYPFDLTLSNSKNKDISSTFTLYLYPALLNKINAFLNPKEKQLYYYEFLYYNISDDLEEINKEIIVNDKKYNITINDNFGSKNRKRISIMNIPYQNCEIAQNEMKTNSIQICELINNGFRRTIGIYDIKNEFKDYELHNDFFDEYYEDFGDIYDMIKKSKLNDKEISEKLEIKLKKYNNKIGNVLIDSNNFCDKMTLSQFKSWFGLIICEYANNSEKKKYTIYDILSIVNQMFKEIDNKNLKFKDIIRILLFKLNRILIKKSNYYDIKFVSDLNKNSPFALAYEFNKNQIQRLNEFSALFQAYLQLDSYIAYNYIHSEYTHTFSLELIFMIKFQLLSTYDDFFFIKNEDGDEYSLIDYKTKITTINIFRSFGKNFEEKDVMSSIDKSKNYAMPLSLHFMHEKSGHYKYSIKNKGFNCPIIYFRGLRIEIEISNNKSIGEFYGESGRIIENFICKDKFIIDQLSSNFIFGEFFTMEYFDGKNFLKLITAVESKLEKLGIKNNEEDNDSHKIQNEIHYEKKNKVKEEKISNLDSDIQVGDVILDLDQIRREKAMTEEEKRERDRRALLNRKNYIKSLRMRKMKNK